MGNRTTTHGYWRQRGGSNSKGTPAVYEAFIKIAFDPTQVLAGTGAWLPKGAIPTGVITLGGGTGGASPTVDVSLAGGAAGGLANEVVADTLSMTKLVAGAELGIELTADTQIEAGVGASAATGGTTTVLVSYLMADDGVAND